MTDRPARRNPPAVQAIRFHRDRADVAYEAHRALIQTEAAHPHLASNPYWGALRDTAYARFLAAFEVTK